jgi:NADH:ubiquinone oxidoreductase subunit
MELEDEKKALILRPGTAAWTHRSLSPAFHSETYKKRNWQRDGIIQQW